jgi:hypothetical protein
VTGVLEETLALWMATQVLPFVLTAIPMRGVYVAGAADVPPVVVDPAPVSAGLGELHAIRASNSAVVAISFNEYSSERRRVRLRE